MIDKIFKDIKDLFKVQDKKRFVLENIPYLAFFYVRFLLDEFANIGLIPMD